MAQFKILLLNLKTNAVFPNKYFTQVISEYYSDTENSYMKNYLDLKSNFSYCYTFNEKFKEGLNSQKTLTFSMIKNITREDRVETNPFVDVLTVGSQLLFIDKYDQHHLMTIKKIDFIFNTNNITYNYECQDSFTYQLSRQKSGYEIKNDFKSEDFLGAHSLDWWIIKKIQPECGINYNYINLENKLQLWQNNNHVNKRVTVKQPISRTNKNLFERIPFAANGTADSVLIQLGKEYGLQLKTYERFYFEDIKDATRTTILKQKNTIDKFYWFEYSKNPRYSGLKYSPNTNIKDFSLSHIGDSLSTVLNVEAVKKDDKLVSLFPKLPEFFNHYFRTKEWNNSLFFTGMFNSILSHESNSMILTSEETPIITTEKVTTISSLISENWKNYYNVKKAIYDNSTLYLPIYSDIDCSKIDHSSLYSYIRFNHNNNYSHIVLNITSNQKNKVYSYSSNIDNWSLLYCEGNNVYIKKDREELINFKADYAFIQIPINNIPTAIDAMTINTYEIYWEFYRNISIEEQEFADIADACPWLENKIIDINYFLQHKILNKQQYNSLQDILQNKLRKVNSQLLIYSVDYYAALEKRIKLISDLSSQIDHVNGILNEELILPYQENKKVKNINNFITEAKNLLSYNIDLNNGDRFIIDYNQIFNKYVSQYINAEQSFLKNLYNFQQFFNSSKDFQDISVYNYVIRFEMDKNFEEISEDGRNYKYIYCFDESKKSKFTNQYNSDKQSKFYGKPNSTIYIKDNVSNSYSSVSLDNILWKEKFWLGNYYRLKKDNDSMVSAKEYHDGVIYYEKAVLYNQLVEFPFLDNKSEQTGIEKFIAEMNRTELGYWVSIDKQFKLRLNEDRNIIITPYQRSFKKDEIINLPQNMEFTSGWTLLNINSESTEISFEKVTDQDIISNYYYCKNNEESDWKKGYYFYSSDNYYSINTGNEAWKKELPQNMNSFISYLPDSKNWTDFDEILENNTCAFNHYKENFPVDAIFYHKDATSGYNLIDFVNINNYYNFYRRINVSGDERQSWNNSIENNQNNSLVDLAIKIYDNGATTFGKTGWTTQDIFGTPLNKNDVFQGYADSKSFLYTKTIKGYSGTTKIQSLEEAQNNLLTYNGVTQNNFDCYYYKTTFWKAIQDNESLSPDNHYKVLIFTNDQLIDSSWIDENGYINKTIYYPLSNLLNDFTWDTTKQLTDLSKILNSLGFSITTNTEEKNKFVISATVGDAKKVNLLVLKECASKPIFLNDNYDIDTLLKTTIYDSSNNVFNPLNEKNVCTDFYILADKNQGYQLNQTDYNLQGENKNSLKDFDINERYYCKRGNNFIPMDTIGTLLNKDSYIAEYLEKHLQSYYPLKDLDLTLKVYKEEEKDGKYNNHTFEKEIQIPVTLSGTLNTENISWEDHPDIKMIISLESTVTETAVNNGNFWYKNRNNTRNFAAQKQAMFIESTLTEYWTNAYYASKNCRYFIPEFWNFQLNKKNNFIDSILKLDQNDIISLNSNFIPTIELVKNKPLYRYQKIAKENSSQEDYDFNLENENIFLATDVCKNNDIIQENFNYLSLNPKEWEAIYLGSTSYYKRIIGGITWIDMIKQLSGNQINLPFFGGQNDLMLYILQHSNYINYNDEWYNLALKEHNILWQHIYDQFPNVILEEKFIDENANTSKELLESAKRAFLDYKRLEKQYNISIIEGSSLKGYHGQKINIGDAIQIESKDLYNGLSGDLVDSLNQFLFISDISYNLRTDAEMNITVNDIKYQDKVLSQLIQLIR